MPGLGIHAFADNALVAKAWMAGTKPAMTPKLLRRLGDLELDLFHILRRRANPGVLGDVEHHAVGAAELGLEERHLGVRVLLHEAGGAELLELLHVRVD